MKQKVWTPNTVEGWPATWRWETPEETLNRELKQEGMNSEVGGIAVKLLGHINGTDAILKMPKKWL